MQYLNGQVLLQGSVEAAGHTAVVRGVDECCGTQDMVQQVAGQSVALFTAHAQGQLQSLNQLCAVQEELFPIHTSHLKSSERGWQCETQQSLSSV